MTTKKRKYDSTMMAAKTAVNSSTKFNATNTPRYLTDGIRLLQSELNTDNGKKDNVNKNNDKDDVILPYVGFGTYRLGKDIVNKSVMKALQCGYRCIDTAFIYGSETTEKIIGETIQQAIQKNVIKDRSDVFIITKHWRKYHGYEPTLECLNLSLKRLQVDYIDLWLIHWPGPAYKTMNRKNEYINKDKWYYATIDQENIINERAETWRAMEDSLRDGKCRSIGVSNFNIEHLKQLKQTATIWPPAVNQVELHPLYPQTDLLEYCKQEGIVVQAYSSLGGQDTGKSAWKQLFGSSLIVDDDNNSSNINNGQKQNNNNNSKARKRKQKKKKQRQEQIDLLNCEPVKKLSLELSKQFSRDITSAQVLLRWAIDQNITIIPKTTSKERMEENVNIFDFYLTKEQIHTLRDELIQIAKENNPDYRNNIEELTRLCWRRDPLRLLDFK